MDIIGQAMPNGCRFRNRFVAGFRQSHIGDRYCAFCGVLGLHPDFCVGMGRSNQGRQDCLDALLVELCLCLDCSSGMDYSGCYATHYILFDTVHHDIHSHHSSTDALEEGGMMENWVPWVLGISAAVINATGYILYNGQTKRGASKPNVASWSIWALMA